MTQTENGEDAWDWEACQRAERRADRVASRAFVEACRSGDGAALLHAVDLLNQTSINGWRLAMRGAGHLPSVDGAIRRTFLHVWIESRTLAMRVGDKRALAAALRVLMPGNYNGPPLRIFRGAQAHEGRCRIHGFSWTTDIQTALDFASQRQRFPGGAIVLEAVATRDAILLVREPEDYFDEEEVVVDPYKLGNVTARERLPHISPAASKMNRLP